MTKSLKKIRLVLAICVGILFLVHFLEGYHLIPDAYTNWLAKLQLVPIVSRLLGNVWPVLAVLLAIVLFTLLFGRVYCSVLCPAGLFQDAVIRIKQKVKKKNRFRYHKPNRVLHYSILSITVLLWILGSVTLVNLLDPYANAGRVLTTVAKPVLVFFNNQLTHLLHHFNVFTLHTISYKVAWIAIIYPLLFLGTLFTLSWMRGRLFCNSVCPVGALLSLFSAKSLFRLQIQNQSCNSCGQCIQSCKAECISVKNKTIDHARCISCYNCVSACGNQAIGYEMAVTKTPEIKPETDNSRRLLLAQGLATITAVNAMASGGNKHGKHGNKHGKGHHKMPDHPACPPGSKSIENFNDRCIACGLCVSKCPTNVLQPGLLEYGLRAFAQPYMNFHVNYCSFDCTVCSDVCPTGAIQPLTLEEKHTTQIGKVHFCLRKCVVETDLTACGSCSEHCPTQAVYMVPYGQDDLTIPEINPDICVGCGACEYACPVTPEKAIFVIPHNIHQVAAKPETQKIDFDPNQDFPF